MEPFIDFGREICGSLESAEAREWLVTNGTGGFASGTVAGLLTRRYHGLLIAALKPPLGRTLLVSKFSEDAEYDGQIFPLSTDRWASGVLDPQGYRYIEAFRLEGTAPVWTYAVADALLEKRVWMQQGSNTTYVRYDLARGSSTLKLWVKALVNYRDFHSVTHGQGWWMEINPIDHGLRVVAFDGATPFYILSASAMAEAAHEWYLGFDLAVERRRGLEFREDHLHAGNFTAEVQPGGSVTFVLTTDSGANLDGSIAWVECQRRAQELIARWERVAPPRTGYSKNSTPSTQGTLPKVNGDAAIVQSAPGWVRQLVLAADQFVVERPLLDGRDGHSLIAGYHWFGDWGRDTMISLPGLTLVTGRPEIARSILRNYSRLVDGGMLPNYSPQPGDRPEYNTVDASLWYFEAVREYFSTTGDEALLQELFPVLDEIVQFHARGTRYRIHVDNTDGLLFAGEPGVQLTWMDAKVDDWVVTPRIGKPVEINALWYNALVSMAGFARQLRRPTQIYQDLAEQARQGFRRFWNKETGWCFDVLDGPDGNDPTLRPNQLFALSLNENLLSMQQERSVLDACTRYLLTSHGLRTLRRGDASYRGHYEGDRRQRDAAYHQGTVWGWLIGPYVLATLKVHNDPVLAASFLDPLARQLRIHGLGTISEIFDGDPPHAPRGCIAQSWSVAEVLRAWNACRQHEAANRDSHELGR